MPEASEEIGGAAGFYCVCDPVETEQDVMSSSSSSLGFGAADAVAGETYAVSADDI